MLERPLTADEQNAVDELSSHIDVTATQAIVTYHWSDFRHDPFEVLAKYFDVHLYFANWGIRRLAFRFPKGLVDAAAERSPSLSPSNQPDFAPLIVRLTRQECDEFLVKIVNAEPGAVATLRKKLLSFEQSKPDVRTEPRTFDELLDTAEKIRQAETHRQAEKRRRKRIAEMQELAKQEAQTWQEVERLIQSGYIAQNYDSATALLSKLRQLQSFRRSKSVSTPGWERW